MARNILSTKTVRIISLIISMTMIFGTLFALPVSASGNVKLFVDGVEKPLTQGIYAADDGTVYVPLVETFEYLGVDMIKGDDGVYTGNGNNGEIIIKVGEDTAEVDWVDIELPAPIIERNNTVMIPAYLIEDAVKTQPAVYDAETGTLSVVSPDPDDVFDDGDDIGEIIKTLPEGTVVFNQEDLYSIKNSTYMNVTDRVRVEVDGVATEAAQFETLAMPYGKIPLASDIGERIYAYPKNLTLTKGDVALIHFKARATATSKDNGTANLQIMYERATDWNKAANANWEIGTSWDDYYLPVYATEKGDARNAEWEASKSSIKICVGGSPQTIQITDFEFIYYGKSITINDLQPSKGSYHGIEEDALWRKEAFRRIEKYRKSDAEVRVVDSEGNPVEGAEIKVEQTENEFMFGVALCYDEVVGLNMTTQEGGIRNNALNSFNAAMSDLELLPGTVAVDGGAKAVEMANEYFRRNMRIRTHALLWDTPSVVNPIMGGKDYTTYSYEELYREILDYALPVAHLFKGKGVKWNVLNEPNNHNYIRLNYGTRLYTDLFNAAHAIDPEAKLYVNETGTMGKNKGDADILPNTLAIVKQMQEEGAHIDGIGLQTHTNEYYYPQGLYRQLDECAQLVDEVAVTEFDFYHENEENIPEFVRDYVIATFSHPKSVEFTAWGYRDGSATMGEGLFYSWDWEEKPTKTVWDNMVNNEFKTKLTLTTDKNGHGDFRGFHGEYKITVNYNGKKQTFDFGIPKDSSNNYINITVGNRITADVSSGKYIYIPEPITYRSLDESIADFRAEFGTPYTSLVLESDLKAVATDALVSAGGNIASNADYINGKKWGSKNGMAAVVADEVTKGDGIIFKNSAAGNYEMSHKYSTENIFDKGSIEMDYRFNTYASRTEGFGLDLAFMLGDNNVSLGKIETAADGYRFATLGGDKVKLADNSIYDIIVTLAQTEMPGVYDLEYTLKRNNTVVYEETEIQTGITSLKSLSGIAVTASCNGAEADNVIMMKTARVRFRTWEDLVEYSPIGDTAEVINEDMLLFDMDDVVSDTDAEYLNGKKWGTNSANVKSAFEYATWGRYLMGIRPEPGDEHQLKKKMISPVAGETFKVEFDYYIQAPSQWHISPGYFDIRLEDGDAGVSRSLVRHEYRRNDYGFRVRFLGDAAGEYQVTEVVEWGVVSTYNRNNIHVVCTFTPNSGGGYDAVMTATNAEGFVTSASLTNILTAEEFEALDTFVIGSGTVSEGTRYGERIAGIKNIVVTRFTDGESDATFDNGDFGGIKFKNLLKKPFDATLLLVRYADGKYSSMDIYEFNGRSDDEGYLSLCLDRVNPEEDSFKVMLVDSVGNMMPLKMADDVVITE